MNVNEIKAKLPEAEVYTFDPDAKTLIVVNRHIVSREAAMGMVKYLPNATILFVDQVREAVAILEVKD
jgi:hypothetical protein